MSMLIFTVWFYKVVADMLCSCHNWLLHFMKPGYMNAHFSFAAFHFVAISFPVTNMFVMKIPVHSFSMLCNDCLVVWFVFLPLVVFFFQFTFEAICPSFEEYKSVHCDLAFFEFVDVL